MGLKPLSFLLVAVVACSQNEDSGSLGSSSSGSSGVAPSGAAPNATLDQPTAVLPGQVVGSGTAGQVVEVGQEDGQGLPVGTEAPVGPASPSGTVDTPSPVEAPSTGACQTAGLNLDGLMYSPGGELLPFPCKPYHPTENNPYAVRCVDAWSWYKTSYPGDEYCILPPEPGKGIQVGAHPQGNDWYAQVSTGDLSGYENPPAEWLLDPGDEEERNYITNSPNQEEIKYYRTNVRMRSGSHHMIVSASAPGTAAAPRGQWVRGSAEIGSRGAGSGSIPGAQRPDLNVPNTLEKPAEDKGLYSVLGPDSDVTYNFHHFNATDSVILKESWENLWFEDDATIRTRGIAGLPVGQVIGVFAQPGETVDMHYSFAVGEEVRVVTLFGHRHAWTSNFSVWVERTGEPEDIVYQSFDWFDQPTYRYDSQAMNPVPAPDKRLDGGHSGVLTLVPGDELHFNCHIAFTDERAALAGAPAPDSIGPLRFANQAFEAEMCILFGSTAGAALSGVQTEQGPLPNFATVD